MAHHGNTIINLTNPSLDIYCIDCHTSLSDDGNSLSRTAARRRVRAHFEKTGHLNYSVTAIGCVNIPQGWR